LNSDVGFGYLRREDIVSAETLALALNVTGMNPNNPDQLLTAVEDIKDKLLNRK